MRRRTARARRSRRRAASAARRRSDRRGTDGSSRRRRTARRRRASRSSPPLTRSIGSNRPRAAATSTIARKSPAGTRPSPVMRLSSNVAIPSICHTGRNALGNATGTRPNTAAHALHEPARAIEVQDVRVFVREDQLEPVGRVADQRFGRGRDHGDLDRVVGNRRRPAVREIRLVDQDDLHASARDAEHRLELPPHALDDARPSATPALPLPCARARRSGPCGSSGTAARNRNG